MLNFLKHGRMAGAVLGAAIVCRSRFRNRTALRACRPQKGTSNGLCGTGGGGHPGRDRGEITVTVYPASQLGGVAEMVDGVRMGSISMAIMISLPSHDWCLRSPSSTRLSSTATAPMRSLRRTRSRAPPSRRSTKAHRTGRADHRRIYRGDRHISSKLPGKDAGGPCRQAFPSGPARLWVSMVKGFGAIPTPVEVAELRPR